MARGSGRTSMRGTHGMSHGPGKTTMHGSKTPSHGPGKTTMHGTNESFGNDSSGVTNPPSNKKKAPGDLTY